MAAAVPPRLTPALFCRPDAWESAGDFWAYFRFQGMELLPFGGAERGTRAEGDRGNMGSKELAAEVPRNREVPSCPFRDPAEMGSAACPIYCRRFPRGNEDEVRKPWAARRRKLLRHARALELPLWTGLVRRMLKHGRLHVHKTRG